MRNIQLLPLFFFSRKPYFKIPCHTHTRKMISIDWLSISVKSLHINGHDFLLPPDYSVEDLGDTNVWEHRFIIHINGFRFATLLWGAKSDLIKTDGLLEVCNPLFYNAKGWYDVFGDLSKWGLKEVGISRLDLCRDFCPNEYVRDIIVGLPKDEYYVTGKRTGSLFWSMEHSNKFHSMWNSIEKIPHCQSWGHKTSSSKWKLYYKTKELLDNGGGEWSKPYIVNQWRKNGLDESNVWRLEVSLMHGNQMNHNGNPLTMEYIHNNYQEIYNDAVAGRFIVRINEGHKDKSNDKVVFLFENKGQRAIKGNPHEPLIHNDMVTVIRHLWGDLNRFAVSQSPSCSDSLMKSLYTIVHFSSLQEYFCELSEGIEIDNLCSTWEPPKNPTL